MLIGCATSFLTCFDSSHGKRGTFPVERVHRIMREWLSKPTLVTPYVNVDTSFSYWVLL